MFTKTAPNTKEVLLTKYTEDENGCWIWNGPKDKDGYGKTTVRQKHIRAHRAFYEALRGSVPEGLVLDHICRVVACTNPDHLEPVTVKENTLRGKAPSAINAKKTECLRGHPFNDGNTFINVRGARVCKPCRKILQDRCDRRKKL